jgi:predicted RNA-binding Zn-ribbon protein involved in translation (DUF1610 family)
MNSYKRHYCYNCINDYVIPDNVDLYFVCPKCGLKPKIWIFDNGRSTACGCWETTYNHFSIHAESIMSVYHRLHNIKDYDPDELRKNWNHYCKTGEILFEHASKRDDGRW